MMPIGFMKDSEASMVIVREQENLRISGKDQREDQFKATGGKSLMRYVIHCLQRRLMLMQYEEGDKLLAPDGKKFYPVFKCDGDYVITDNTDTFLNQTGDRKCPEVLFGRKLVMDMGWIGQDYYSNYMLNGNFMKVFPTDEVPIGLRSDWNATILSENWSPFWILTQEG